MQGSADRGADPAWENMRILGANMCSEQIPGLYQICNFDADYSLRIG